MKKTLLSLVFLLMAVFLHSSACCGQNITVNGGWSQTLTAPTAAGTDFAASFSSAANATIVTIGNTGGGSWNVTVQLTGTSGWNSAFTLTVHRTGDGTGNKNSTINYVNDPASLQISTGPIKICNGTRNRNTIPFQYTLTGATLTVPPGTYTTNVTYTVVSGL